MAEPGKRDRPGRKHALAVLRYRNFRLLWFGQLASTTGQQMQTVTLAWHVFVMTDSTFQVGLIAFFVSFPSWSSPSLAEPLPTRWTEG